MNHEAIEVLDSILEVIDRVDCSENGPSCLMTERMETILAKPSHLETPAERRVIRWVCSEFIPQAIRGIAPSDIPMPADVEATLTKMDA